MAGDDYRAEAQRERERERMRAEAEQLIDRLNAVHTAWGLLAHAVHQGGKASQIAAMDEFLGHVGDLSQSFTAARELWGEGLDVAFEDPRYS